MSAAVSPRRGRSRERGSHDGTERASRHSVRGSAAATTTGSRGPMTFFRGELYVGGQFLTAGGVAARTSRGGTAGPAEPGRRRRGGRLSERSRRSPSPVTGSTSAAISRWPGGRRDPSSPSWDGARWQPVPVNTSESVRAIAAADPTSTLPAGSFTMPDGVKTNGIVKWDGSAVLGARRRPRGAAPSSRRCSPSLPPAAPSTSAGSVHRPLGRKDDLPRVERLGVEVRRARFHSPEPHQGAGTCPRRTSVCPAAT